MSTHDTDVDDRKVMDAFLEGATMVADAVTSDVVAELWDSPSVLEDQTVGGLAGHLARGSVWAVADYLAGDEPDGPLTFDSAGAYIDGFALNATAEFHAAIRERGAAVAAGGPEAVADELRRRLGEIRRSMAALPPGRRVTVVGGAVMRLEDYLRTRIVEQTVHLDDLGRSVDRTWSSPESCMRITLDVGLDVARRRHGDAAVLRGLFRRGFGDVFPVL